MGNWLIRSTENLKISSFKRSGDFFKYSQSKGLVSFHLTLKLQKYLLLKAVQVVLLVL